MTVDHAGVETLFAGFDDRAPIGGNGDAFGHRRIDARRTLLFDCNQRHARRGLRSGIDERAVTRPSVGARTLLNSSTAAACDSAARAPWRLASSRASSA